MDEARIDDTTDDPTDGYGIDTYDDPPVGVGIGLYEGDEATDPDAEPDGYTIDT